jgi:hypothetical protein
MALMAAMNTSYSLASVWSTPFSRQSAKHDTPTVAKMCRGTQNDALPKPYLAGIQAPDSMPMAGHIQNVDYSLMRRLSSLLLCSRCLKHGVRRPVVQVISARHRAQPLCPTCRAISARSRDR